MEDKLFDIITLTKPDIDEYPKTISSCWLEIMDMKSIYEFNDHFVRNVETLKLNHKIFAWKRSRGDGNCYFRAVISAFFLVINKPYLPDRFLFDFVEKLKNLKTDDLDYDYESARLYMHCKLTTLYEQRVQSPYHSFKQAYELIQDEEFDLNLIRIARLLTYNKMDECSKSDEYSWMFLDGKDFILNDVSDMGKEGGELSLLFLPMSLGIQVNQYMYLDQPDLVITKFPDEVPEKSIQIHIVRRGAHYDILSTIQQMETEGINIKEGQIYVLKNYKLIQGIFYNRCFYLG
jgi:hypothetical protein